MSAFDVDKSEWERGEWDDEPDFKQWQSHGLVCLAVRNNGGGLCGYVGVKPGHPAYGRDLCGSEYDERLDPHGGVTFSRTSERYAKHVDDENGEARDLFWVGFDCAHSGDASPAYSAIYKKTGLAYRSELGETYKNIAFVTAEVERLAKQLKEMESQ